MNERHEVIFRYDDAPHHRNLKTFPHHKHLSDVVEGRLGQANYVPLLQEDHRFRRSLKPSQDLSEKRNWGHILICELINAEWDAVKLLSFQ